MRRILEVGVACTLLCASAQAQNATQQVAAARTSPVAAIANSDSTRRADSVTARPATPATAPAAPAKAAPVPLVTNVGSIRFSGLLQAGYISGTSDVTNTFRVRRAELKFIGTVNPDASWTVMFDAAKAAKVSGSAVTPASLVLQDAFVTLKSGRVAVDVGQYKLPVSYEASVQSTAALETVEAAAYIADGKLGNIRDVGAQALVTVTSAIKARLGVFNGVGEGQNTVDLNDAKSAVARVDVALPAGLRTAASFTWSGPVRTDNAPHDRAQVEAEYVSGASKVRGEFVRSWDDFVTRQGYYALGVYALKSVQLVGKFDVYDKNVRSVGNADGRDIGKLVGINYLVSGSDVRVQANYVHRKLGVQPSRHMVLVNVQTSW